MGSSESTTRSNGTEEEEEERQQKNNRSRGAGTAIAIAAAGTVVAAWGISRMLSGSTETESQEKDDVMKIKAHGMEPSLPNFRIDSHIEYESKQPSIWNPPPPGQFKMNTDGTSRPNPGPSGYGGILRNDRGHWVRGFRGFIGVSDSLTAEFHGILKGMELLDKLGLKDSILESDNQGAVEWVTRQDDDRGNTQIIHDCWHIIKKIRHLALKNNIIINHIDGEDVNQCADRLAKMGREQQEEYVEIKDLPHEIKDLVDSESRGF